SYSHPFFFFFNSRPTTKISTLSLHDALPISNPLDVFGTDERLIIFDSWDTRLCHFFSRFVYARSGYERRFVLELFSRGEAKNRRSEEHTSELQSRGHLVCRLLLEKKKVKKVR